MLLTSTRAKRGMAGLLGYTASVIGSYFHSSVRNEQERLRDETEPYIRHKTLHEFDLLGKDLVIIGDVHGCFDETMNLLDKVKKQTSNSFVTIFVGDMINKGPKNIEMLNFIMKATNTHCIRGNHEQKILLKYLDFKRKKIELPTDHWIRDLSTAHLQFLKNLPYTISIPSLKAVIVHAGLEPGKGLHLHDANDIANMRNLMWVDDRFHGKVLKPTSCSGIGIPWVDLWNGPEHVYFGHDALKKLQLNEYSTGLDTGCVYGGKLTCVLLRLCGKQQGPIEKQIISVNPIKVYVPVDS